MARILRAFGRGLAAAWRICGSPRIWGDAWVWDRLTRLYAGWRRIAGRWAAPTAIGFASTLVIVVIVVIAVAAGGGEPSAAPGAKPEPTPTPGPRYLTEIQALPLAVMALHENGFIGETFSHIARRVPFLEYATAIGQAFQAEEGHLEVPPEREVWVFAFKGDVRLDLPDGQPAVYYDNLTVVLDALTGALLRAEAFYGDFKSPLRAPVWLRIPTPSPEPE